MVVTDDLAEELDDIRDKRDPECEFKRYDFYPGQVLFGAIRNLESGSWSECSPVSWNIVISADSFLLLTGDFGREKAEASQGFQSYGGGY